MHIDIHALPIPHECDLQCPRCGYPLRGLPSHVCPECGLRLELDKLVRPWTRLRVPRLSGDELPFPDFGLVCRRCQAPLAGAASRACPACGEPFDPHALRPAKPWVSLQPSDYAGLAPPILEMLLLDEQIPHMVHEGKTAVDHYTGSNPVGTRSTGVRILIAGDFYFEVLELLARTRRDMRQARAAPDDLGWTCTACGEESPAHFEICWKCEAPRLT
jgi:hypothetical protein